MKEEKIEIFDEKNEPTGEILPRSSVHGSGLWHRVVHIYVLRTHNDSLEFLVHLRAVTKDLSPNKWDVRFGGHVIVGNSVEQTAIKELHEEIGITISKKELIDGPWYKREGLGNNEHTKVYFFKFAG